MTADDVEQIFFEHVPEALVPRLMRAVFTAHKVARDETRSQYEPSEAANVLPYARRGKLEGYMRGAADMESGVSYKVAKAREGNWNHTELWAGPVVITANAVPYPCGLVEKAEFRLTLAKDSQLSLWDAESAAAAERRLYALLLHSASAWDDPGDWQKYGHLPGSIYLAFPSPNLRWYVHAMNLFERYPIVVQDQMPQDWAEEAKVAYLDRARRVLAA